MAGKLKFPTPCVIPIDNSDAMCGIILQLLIITNVFCCLIGVPPWWTLWVASHMCVANCIDQLLFNACDTINEKEIKKQLAFIELVVVEIDYFTSQISLCTFTFLSWREHMVTFYYSLWILFHAILLHKNFPYRCSVKKLYVHKLCNKT